MAVPQSCCELVAAVAADKSAAAITVDEKDAALAVRSATCSTIKHTRKSDAASKQVLLHQSLFLSGQYTLLYQIRMSRHKASSDTQIGRTGQQIWHLILCLIDNAMCLKLLAEIHLLYRVTCRRCCQ